MDFPQYSIHQPAHSRMIEQQEELSLLDPKVTIEETSRQNMLAMDGYYMLATSTLLLLGKALDFQDVSTGAKITHMKTA